MNENITGKLSVRTGQDGVYVLKGKANITRRVEMDIKFLSLNPKDITGEIEALKKVKMQGYYLLGFEVTIADLSAFMDLSIDPQHAGQDLKTACIDETLSRAKAGRLLPGHSKVAVATVRPDLDSVGSMAIAVMALTVRGLNLGDYAPFEWPSDRVRQISEADKFSSASEWKPTELFTQGNNAPEIAPVAMLASDWKVPLKDRVMSVIRWLERGESPTAYVQQANEARKEIRDAVDSGKTTVSVESGIAIVHSTLRAAPSIGYSKSPVVIAINEAFTFGDGPAHRKVTICQYALGYCDLKAVFAELNESCGGGWGGSPSIGGSPQGLHCDTPVDELKAVVKRHLTRKA